MEPGLEPFTEQQLEFIFSFIEDEFSRRLSIEESQIKSLRLQVVKLKHKLKTSTFKLKNAQLREANRELRAEIAEQERHIERGEHLLREHGETIELMMTERAALRQFKERIEYARDMVLPVPLERRQPQTLEEAMEVINDMGDYIFFRELAERHEAGRQRMLAERQQQAEQQLHQPQNDRFSGAVGLRWGFGQIRLSTGLRVSRTDPGAFKMGPLNGQVLCNIEFNQHRQHGPRLYLDGRVRTPNGFGSYEAAWSRSGDVLGKMSVSTANWYAMAEAPESAPGYIKPVLSSVLRGDIIVGYQGNSIKGAPVEWKVGLSPREIVLNIPKSSINASVPSKPVKRRTPRATDFAAMSVRNKALSNGAVYDVEASTTPMRLIPADPVICKPTHQPRFPSMMGALFVVTSLILAVKSIWPSHKDRSDNV